MSPQDATVAAQAILAKRAGDTQFKVLVDSPNDCHATIVAFRKLGCKVKVEQDGARLIVTRSAS
jgi:5-enolpyruvylshikimate-3-phosphate synthase